MTLRRILFPLAACAFAIVMLLIWQAAAQARWVNPIFFPSPGRILEVLWQQVRAGAIWEPLGATSMRMLVGWAAALVLGISLGALISSSHAVSEYLESSLEFLRTLPASAVLPFFVAFLGLTPQMIMAIIVFGAIWPVLLSSLHGFRSLEPRLVEVGSCFGLTRWEQLVKIKIPSAIPDILAGARVSLAFALILAIVAEMLSSQQGLGYSILLASRSFKSADLYAGIVILGAVGLVCAVALTTFESRLLRWRPSNT
jgi:ABC-type nitrate/sulfonate/bicarbonate transport system permease component